MITPTQNTSDQTVMLSLRPSRSATGAESRAPTKVPTESYTPTISHRYQAEHLLSVQKTYERNDRPLPPTAKRRIRIPEPRQEIFHGHDTGDLARVVAEDETSHRHEDAEDDGAKGEEGDWLVVEVPLVGFAFFVVGEHACAIEARGSLWLGLWTEAREDGHGEGMEGR